MAVSFTQACLRRLAFGLAALFLAGCATMARSPEMAVRQRATDNWKARQASDYEKAYAFMPPSYRAVTPLERYKKSFGVAAQLTGSEVDQVVCETEDKCVVTLKLVARVPLQRANTPPIVTYYDEVWIRENGQWWVFPTQ